MIDREKVIKGLACCIANMHNNCPYESTDEGIDKVTSCTTYLMKDALALLKEQKAGADSGMCEICSFYERAMPVKPHYNARTNWYECGACRYSMTSGMHFRSELIPAYKVGFCAKCGKAVKWDG